MKVLAIQNSQTNNQSSPACPKQALKQINFSATKFANGKAFSTWFVELVRENNGSADALLENKMALRDASHDKFLFGNAFKKTRDTVEGWVQRRISDWHEVEKALNARLKSQDIGETRYDSDALTERYSSDQDYVNRHDRFEADRVEGRTDEDRRIDDMTHDGYKVS